MKVRFTDTVKPHRNGPIISTVTYIAYSEADCKTTEDKNYFQWAADLENNPDQRDMFTERTHYKPN